MVKAGPEIPDKLYFKIGEVARITKVKPYILRYWESEFKIIKPQKSQGNQRVYRKKDVELIVFIKNLLYKEKFTLDGAKKRVREFKKEEKAAGKKSQMALPFTEKKLQSEMRSIRKELASVLKILT
ncbi:Transcriptional regulator PA2737, MerR family [hydrothermal vent metagenome]|uniref:Transcriptional regulator PA2737, MerR family n=1 Tax=hydrothermal vent metagenome TaxID=652676 RepID=A0A3B0QX71_9ZZZZ